MKMGRMEWMQRFRSLLSLALAFLIHLIRPLRND